LYFTRPLAIKKFKTGKVKTNVDSLVGMSALVTRQIREFERGEVKLNGQFWTARSEDGSTINEGTKCEVVRIEGVQAIVRMPDTGVSDISISDTGVSDTGVSDTGVSDTGVSDTGVSDTGVSNTGVSNTGVSNTGVSDNNDKNEKNI
jgi:hypothetical protein